MRYQTCQRPFVVDLYLVDPKKYKISYVPTLFPNNSEVDDLPRNISEFVNLFYIIDTIVVIQLCNRNNSSKIILNVL